MSELPLGFVRSVIAHRCQISVDVDHVTRSITQLLRDDGSVQKTPSSPGTAALSAPVAERLSRCFSRLTTSTAAATSSAKRWGGISTSNWRMVLCAMTFAFFATTATVAAGSMEVSVPTSVEVQTPAEAPWCGPVRLTAYVRTEFSPWTYDGTPISTPEPIVAASWDVKMGSLADIDGLGTFRVADRGMLGNGHPMPWVDVAVWDRATAYSLTGVRRVCFRPPPVG